jgi:hypothetical protein
MFRQDDLSQFFLGNSGPFKRQNEQRTQYFRDYEKSKRSRQFLKEWKQNRPWLVDPESETGKAGRPILPGIGTNSLGSKFRTENKLPRQFWPS